MSDTGLDWFMLDRPEFLHADACAITDMPDANLQNWANRKLLDGLEASGKGTRRTYSTTHLAAITFAREMIAIGFETGLALSVGMTVYVSLLKRMKEALKAGKSAPECERIILGTVAFVSPDKDKFKHRVEFCDVEDAENYSLPIDRAVIFLPAGPLLAKTITEALKIETAKNNERKARSLSAAAVGARHADAAV